MLESVETKHTWQWAACGKHPLVKDYLTLGRNDGLFKRFATWVEEGYQIVAKRKDFHPCGCCWRFWAGQKGGMLVCGVIKDSNDQIGRPYPLLLLGIGSLEKWEEHWDLLPFACERTWYQMEYFAAVAPRDIRHLESELRRMHEPLGRWGELAKMASTLAPSASERDQALQKELRNVGIEKTRFIEDDVFWLNLTQNSLRDPKTAVVFWHFVLKSNSNLIPNAVFMGGGINRSYLGVYKRPLVPADLVILWEIEKVRA